MSEDIEIMHEIEEVTYIERRIREVEVKLLNREPVEWTAYSFGRKGSVWLPVQLDIKYEQINSDPWTTSARLTVSQRLKSGVLSAERKGGLGFEVPNERLGYHPYGYAGWPYVAVPEWLPGVIEAHAPDGWIAPR